MSGCVAGWPPGCLYGWLAGKLTTAGWPTSLPASLNAVCMTLPLHNSALLPWWFSLQGCGVATVRAREQVSCLKQSSSHLFVVNWVLKLSYSSMPVVSVKSGENSCGSYEICNFILFDHDRNNTASYQVKSSYQWKKK